MSDGDGTAAPDAETEAAPGTPAAAVRGPELAVAAILMVLALIVIADSIRVGTGWADDGPRAGYFPFYIGLLLLGSGGWILVTTLLKWKRLTQPFVMREEISGVWAVLWPSVVYVAVMPLLGLYLASTLLIAFFMRRHGRFGWVTTVLVSVGVSVVFFMVFERWFLVPLPKGPIENVLGF